MSTSPVVLVVSQNPSLLQEIEASVEHMGQSFSVAQSYAGAIHELRKHQLSLVISDTDLPDRSGIELLRSIKELNREISVILVSESRAIPPAVEATLLGARDYIPASKVAEKLDRALVDCLNTHPSSSSNSSNYLPIGSDPAFREVYQFAERVAPTCTTVLIQGEHGTGKTMTARSIHRMSPRRDQPFVEVACGTLADSLLEAELFGHVAGAFTGAHVDRAGKFLQADGGTIFLDEISEASPAMQVKLLRVLQDRKFSPVGSNDVCKVDVRLIFATNKDLEVCVKEGKFRQDLMYRVNTFAITQPPLRERKEDIEHLLFHYLKLFNKELGKNIRVFEDSALRLLQNYNWPGNIRELVSLVERAVVLAKSDTITLADLPESVLYSGFHAKAPPEQDLKRQLFKQEKRLLIDALQLSDWNRNETAKRLGVSRFTLYKKMASHGLYS